MASLRKRYQDHLEDVAKDAPAIAPTPQASAAELPPPMDAAKPAEPAERPETENPVEVASRKALSDRLREMENAERLSREGMQQQLHSALPPVEPEPQPQDPFAQLPERVQRWYRDNPKLAADPEQAARVNYCHHVAAREVGEAFTEPYYDRMEQMLGLRPRQSNGNGYPQQSVQPVGQRQSAPRQQAFSGAPVSAPPSREVPSMSTGKRVTDRVPLTREEVELALQGKHTPEESDQVAIQRYEQNKKKMLELKAAGAIQDGRG